MANVNSTDPNTGAEIIRNRYHDNTTVKDGVRYTTEDDPNKLTNNDFLELMITEMKMQDPTKPMDSQSLMDSQLKMSTIESNLEMAESMKALQQSYSNSALSTASSMIGKIIEDGSENEDGLLSSYVVETIENKGGSLYANAREMVGLRDALYNSETEKLTVYDPTDGTIYEDGEKTEYRIVLNEDNRFDRKEDGTLKLLDKDNNEVTDEAILEKYKYYNSSPLYAEETTAIPMENIIKVRS